MRIARIKIRNFRSIKEIEISPIGDALILVGKNNVGKSAILSAIGVFFGEKTPTESDFHKRDTSKQILIEITFELSDIDLDSLLWDGTYGINGNKVLRSTFKLSNGRSVREVRDELQEIIQHRKTDELKKHELYLTWLNKLKEKLGIYQENSRQYLTMNLIISKNNNSISQRYTTPTGEELKKPQLRALLPELAYISDERNFSNEEQSKRNTWTEKLTRLYWKGANDSLVELENDLYEDLSKMIKQYEEEINKFFQEHYGKKYVIKLDPKIDIKKAVNIEVKMKPPGISEKVPLTYVGAGIRSMYLVSLLEAYLKLSRTSQVIFVFEEPEIYLHPELQKKMARILYELSRRAGNQVFFSTHSPLLLRHFDISEVKHVYMSSGTTKIKEAKLSQVLSDLGYSTVDVIHKEFVIVVEGSDDARRLTEILSKFTGWSVDEVRRRVYFLEAKGAKNISAYATLRFMGMTELKDNFAIIRDSDMISPNKLKERLINAYKENTRIGKKRLGNHILVLKYSSLENYFIDYDVLMNMGIIQSKDEYIKLLKQFIKENRENIEEYWKKKKNIEDKDLNIESYRQQLFSEDISDDEFIENCKRLIRGHDLYDYLWDNLIRSSDELKRRFGSKERYDSAYINSASWETFAEILDFLSSLDYFKGHLIKEKTEDKGTLMTWLTHQPAS